uniref:Ig-like domain-containing protein n=1 Tax=Astyanax mexicanus TaxID=7994 RepID=A0A3B1IFZ1_ASTMX
MCYLSVPFIFLSSVFTLMCVVVWKLGVFRHISGMFLSWQGESLTVPCLYEEKYKSHRKYWCKGEHWISCTKVAKTNTSNTGISVTDYPSQNMFTVDLKNLQDSDSGWYWCAVDIDGAADDGDSVQLTVSSGESESLCVNQNIFTVV